MTKVKYQGIDKAQEPTHLKDDVHLLRIIKATHGPGKTDPNKFRTEFILDCPQEPDTQGVFHYIGDPNPDGDPKGESYKFLLAKRFFMHFDVPFDEEGFDPDDALGKEAETRTLTEKDEETGRSSTKLLLPELGV